MGGLRLNKRGGGGCIVLAERESKRMSALTIGICTDLNAVLPLPPPSVAFVRAKGGVRLVFPKTVRKCAVGRKGLRSRREEKGSGWISNTLRLLSTASAIANCPRGGKLCKPVRSFPEKREGKFPGGNFFNFPIECGRPFKLPNFPCLNTCREYPAWVLSRKLFNFFRTLVLFGSYPDVGGGGDGGGGGELSRTHDRKRLSLCLPCKSRSSVKFSVRSPTGSKRSCCWRRRHRRTVMINEWYGIRARVINIGFRQEFFPLGYSVMFLSFSVNGNGFTRAESAPHPPLGSAGLAFHLPGKIQTLGYNVIYVLNAAAVAVAAAVAAAVLFSSLELTSISSSGERTEPVGHSRIFILFYFFFLARSSFPGIS